MNETAENGEVQGDAPPAKRKSLRTVGISIVVILIVGVLALVLYTEVTVGRLSASFKADKSEARLLYEQLIENLENVDESSVDYIVFLRGLEERNVVTAKEGERVDINFLSVTFNSPWGFSSEVVSSDSGTADIVFDNGNKLSAQCSIHTVTEEDILLAYDTTRNHSQEAEQLSTYEISKRNSAIQLYADMVSGDPYVARERIFNTTLEDALSAKSPALLGVVNLALAQKRSMVRNGTLPFSFDNGEVRGMYYDQRGETNVSFEIFDKQRVCGFGLSGQGMSEEDISVILSSVSFIE